VDDLVEYAGRGVEGSERRQGFRREAGLLRQFAASAQRRILARGEPAGISSRSAFTAGRI